jgi:hypothetical protein
MSQIKPQIHEESKGPKVDPTPDPPKYDPSSATPEAHGLALGLIRATRRSTVFNKQNSPIRSPAYRAAEVLHGWSVAHLHSATPLLLSVDDFQAAIKATEKPDARGVYTPHAPALAPHLRGNR